MNNNNFKNSILVVLFNYSNCIKNKDFIKKIYENHFKTIIFYSDYHYNNEDKDIDVNFIYTNKGFKGHNIFKDLYIRYKELIEDSDGLFYTMDDNIINVNILNLFDSNKIIFYYNEIKSIDNYSDWWWTEDFDGYYGKKAISNLTNDDKYKKYNIDKYSGAFSDFFYLPKKYLDEKIFDLFEIFSKYEVFLEIAIPTIINNIEKDKNNYQDFKNIILWEEDRKKVNNYDYIYNSFNHEHNLIIHPIKFNENNNYKKWLQNIFCKEKCVIITTINKPTETIIKHINNINYDVIIIGDNKTPNDYQDLKCIYLDINSQKNLFPELSELLPYNHYSRKNLGYLYAIKKGYKIIYETDDDNIPNYNFDMILNNNNDNFIITENNNKWINIFKYFTNNNYIWPRGFPLSLIKIEPNFTIDKTNKKPSIINGLVNNDPDVDALFRIICNHQDSIKWDDNKNILINNNNICVFNTQNTFWINPELFICLIIPSYVSFRYCDILRGIITNIILKKRDLYMMYSSPNVYQIRNEHNLMNDFKDEIEMYFHNEKILNFIDENNNDIITIKDLLKNIYKNLLKNNIIIEKEIEVLNKWLSYF